MARATKTTSESAAIERAIHDRDGERALELALAWWRETRAPAIANLIDAISSRVSGPPIAVREWQAIASRKVQLGALLPTVTELAASFLPTAATLLAAFPDDPRITAALAAWIGEPPTTSSSTYPFWTTMFELAARTRDTRLAAACTGRLARPPEKSKFWPKFYAALERTKTALAAARPAAVDAKAIAKLATAAAKLAPTAPAKAAKAVTTSAGAKSDERLLVQARERLIAGDLATAIDRMVERWRAIRVPALADLIDRASTLLPSYDLPFAQPKAKDHQVAWEAAFADGPANLPRLLDGLLQGGPKLAELRLVALANLPDDPRVAARLASLCDLGYRAVSPERTQFWKLLFEQLARIADVRTAEPLRAAFAINGADFAGTYYDHHRQAKRLIAPFALAPSSQPAAWPVYPTTPERTAAAALATAIDRAIAADPARALVAAIVDAPDELGPRTVYADWLSERGHPRGEAIVLAEAHHAGTATPAQLDRLADLYHGGDLFGPLGELCAFATRGPLQEPTVHLADYTAKCPRGLPKHLVLYTDGLLHWQRALDHPLMPLVESVTLREEVETGPIIALVGARYRFVEARRAFVRASG